MFYDGVQEGVRYRVHHEGQVLQLAADDASWVPLSSRLPQAYGDPFVSAAVLALKAKQVDDGIYAALELAAQRGAGLVRGKRAVLEALLSRMSGDAEGDARATLEAAASLGEGRASASGRASEIRAGFLGDALRSKPIGFYTWTEELARIFQQDRLLQTDLGGAKDLIDVAEELRLDPALRASYEAAVRLPERLTNALAAASLRDVMAALDRNAKLAHGPVAFLPASRAHETDLVMKLYGERPIPDGFDLGSALIDAIRGGTIDLAPSASSGWYDVQTWTLETLVAPARGAESKSLVFDPSYAAHLEQLFRGILTATRETHVKQLVVPQAGAAAPRRAPKLRIAPKLSVEPLVTYYQRRADSYRYVHGILVEIFGATALAELHGLRRAGPVKESLGVELTAMTHLFDGAAATAMRELGIPTEWDSSTFDAWRGGEGDPDVDEDIRAMVPVFHDVGRGKTKAWIILGWARTSLSASFVKPPRVEVLAGGPIEIELGAALFHVTVPVMVETYVSRVLDREELRRLCDTHKTKDAILAALA
jgi:hypothetical protein